MATEDKSLEDTLRTQLDARTGQDDKQSDDSSGAPSGIPDDTQTDELGAAQVDDASGEPSDSVPEEVQEASAQTGRKSEPAKAKAETQGKLTATDKVDRAPQSWTPGAREKWAGLPPEVKQEVTRVERETRKTLQENASLRGTVGQQQEFAAEVANFVKPYDAIFRPQGLDPFSGIASVMNAYQELHMGSPLRKAQIIAGLLAQFSDPASVNAVMASGAYGQPVQQAAAKPQAAAPDVKALVQKELQEHRHSEALQNMQDKFEKFCEEKSPEFLEDVWDDMITVLNTYEARKKPITYEQAYDLACKMNPAVEKVVAQRKAAQAATRNPARKAAGATLRTTGAQGGAPVKEHKFEDREGILRQVWDEVAQRKK